MKNAQTNNNDKINMVMWIEDRDMITLPMLKRKKTISSKVTKNPMNIDNQHKQT